MKAKILKKEIIKELMTNPNMSYVCSKLNISRQSLYRWMANDRSFKKDVSRAQKYGDMYINDMAENALHKKIKSNYWPAIKYVLDKKSIKYNAFILPPSSPTPRMLIEDFELFGDLTSYTDFEYEDDICDDEMTDEE